MPSVSSHQQLVFSLFSQLFEDAGEGADEELDIYDDEEPASRRGPSAGGGGGGPIELILELDDWVQFRVS